MRNKRTRKPNLTDSGSPEHAVCYVCDETRPLSKFSRERQDVCVDCARMRAYQEVSVTLSFTKWCRECESHEPLTAFWHSDKRGLDSICGIHRAEQKRERREALYGYDGYRKRWFMELRKRVACSFCGDTRDLCFVHLNPDDKAFGISGAYNTEPIDAIKNELLKCEVLCRDCMTDMVNSTLYAERRVRDTPMIDWLPVFVAVDEIVTPLTIPKRDTQLKLSL